MAACNTNLDLQWGGDCFPSGTSVFETNYCKTDLGVALVEPDLGARGGVVAPQVQTVAIAISSDLVPEAGAAYDAAGGGSIDLRGSCLQRTGRSRSTDLWGSFLWSTSRGGSIDLRGSSLRSTVRSGSIDIRGRLCPRSTWGRVK